MADGRYIENRF